MQINDNNPLKDYLNDYYGSPNPQIDFGKIMEWYKPVKKTISKNIAITTFSDNPLAKNPKHGIDGIGERNILGLKWKKRLH